MNIDYSNLTPLKHQSYFIKAVKDHWLRYYFFIGGYRCGKSFTIVFLILWLAEMYKGQDVSIGLGGTTITFIKKTYIFDLETVLIKNKIPYKIDNNSNILTLGSVKFFMIATSQPKDIYGFTFNAFLCDEIDELSQDKGEECFNALNERCSRAFPDGRQPFACFFTTAQGMKTAYTLTQRLDDEKIPFILIRGKTKDNTYNDPSYVKSLYELYDENERLAFLEGEFVNLQAGRVYSDYKMEECQEEIEILPNDTIYIGQDLNEGFSKASVIVKRNKKMYVIKTFSFKAIGDAPRIIRTNYPTQDIYWYPDNAGQSRMVLSGYHNEIRSHNIQLRTGTTNPSILERIFLLNKAFKCGILKISKDCKDLDIALKTRCFDDAGRPEKGSGEKAPDHICDSLEYVTYRLIMSDMDFNFLKTGIHS